MNEVKGDGDSLLEFGEIWKVVIHLDDVYGRLGNVKLRANDVMIVEAKPSVSSILWRGGSRRR